MIANYFGVVCLMKRTYITARAFAGLGLVLALVLAGQPLLQPLHVLLHHASDHVHADVHGQEEHACGHHHDHGGHAHAPDVDTASGSRYPHALEVSGDPVDVHPPCHICEILSATSRTKALLASKLVPYVAPEADAVYGVHQLLAARAPLAAVGRAPPVVVG
jgi:hypothetical protein